MSHHICISPPLDDPLVYCHYIYIDKKLNLCCNSLRVISIIHCRVIDTILRFTHIKVRVSS